MSVSEVQEQPRLLLDADVREREIQVHAGRRRDRTQGVVGREPDLVRLAPVGHLPRLGDPADKAEIGPSEVDQILLDQLPKLPLARVVLARGERDVDVLPEVAEELDVLGADGILEEVRPGRLNAPCQRDRVRGVEPSVDVEADLDVGADRVAQRLHAGDRLAHDDRRLVAVALLRRAPPDEPPALLDGGEAALDQPLELMPADVTVGRHPVADEPAEQAIHGKPESPRVQVPERDVDRRDRGAQDVAAGEETAPEHHLPEVLDPSRILPDKPRLQGLDRGGAGEDLRAHPGLADAADAFVGLDDDDEGVPEG